MDKIFEIFSIVIEKVKEYVEDAEKIYTGIGQGKLKKEYVLAAISKIIDQFGVFTYKNIVLSFASSFIDLLVRGYNLSGRWAKKVKIDIKEGEEL